MNTLEIWRAGRAAVAPDAAALVTAEDTCSFGALAQRVEATRRALARLEVRAGDTVAALLPNGLAFAELLFATLEHGAVLLPLNTRLAPREIARQLRESGARRLLHDARFEAAARDAARDAGAPRVALEAGALSALGARAESGSAPIPAAPERDPSDAAVVVYTSGSSGSPKGVELSHANLGWSALASGLRLGVQADDRWLLCLPAFHVGGLSILLRCAAYGAAAVLHDGFDAEAVSRALDTQRVSHVSLVATTLRRLLDARGERPAPPTLRCVLLGGGPAPPGLVQRARSRGFPVAETYGLSEAASQVATRAPSAPPAAGLAPLFGLRLRIASAEGGDAAPGERGEIQVRGPTLMRGYRGRPEETARALAGGWLHTGDLGRLDETGALHVDGRRSDLIVSGGENVSPAEIETVLGEHPDVVEAGVAGVSDAEYGSRPAAFLVLREGAAPGAAALRRFCRERLAGYKVPVAFRRVASLPRTSLGKLARGELAEGEELS